MVLATYFGFVTDVVKTPLTDWFPEMTVRPMVAAYGPDGLVSEIRVPVELNAATGAFSFQAIPSGELTPADGGSPGVDYIVSVGRFELGDDNVTVWRGNDTWQFTAVAGGGNVGQMTGGSLLAVWVEPNWPPLPSPPGVYIEISPPSRLGVVKEMP